VIGKRIAAIVVLVALPVGLAWGEGVVTISGQGNGPVTIVEKDGTVKTVNLPGTSKLEAQGKAHAEAREARLKQEEEDARIAAEAKTKAAEEAEAKRKKEEEARAKHAAAQAKVLKEKEAARKKEIAHYIDKDYTYGPGTAGKVDRTAAVVGAKKAIREKTSPAAKDAADNKGAQVTVGGEVRVRAGRISR
jgi:hypothetical protein